jgi:hypothetical protein
LFPSTAPIADQISLTFTALEEQAVTFTETYSIHVDASPATGKSDRVALKSTELSLSISPA